MKKANLLLLIIISIYGFLYIATSKTLKCEDDCEKFQSLQTYFLKDSN